MIECPLVQYRRVVFFETARTRVFKVGLQDPAIDKLHQTTSIVGVVICGQVSIDSHLTENDNPVDLLLKVREVRLNNQEVLPGVEMVGQSKLNPGLEALGLSVDTKKIE